jgi:hypothetical protein
VSDEIQDQPEYEDTGLPGEPGLPGRPDPRERPYDPAGTKPKVDSESLLPSVRESLLREPPPATEPGPADPALLPEPAGAGAAPAEAAEPEVDPPHTPRFQFMLGALFALGLAAVAAVVALAINGTPAHHPDAVWSAWRPTGDDPPSEIAQYVGQRYHHESGEQLVNVSGSGLEIEGTPLQLVISQGGNYYPVNGDGVLYNLCGIGAKDCRIPVGKPSAQRLLLLRRESLELALYTFKYTDADNVVAILPLGAKKTKGGKTTFRKRQDLAVFLQRSDVEEQLDRPLDTTLTDEAPPVGTVAQWPDSGSVQALTGRRSFSFRLQAAGVDGAYMVLSAVA